MSGINKILKNKFGIDRESKSVQQDKWLKLQRTIEEDLLLQQQLVEAKQELIEEEELQDIKEQPKPVPVLVSQTSLAEASALALVDMREAVKLVKDKTLPTKEETIESTQELITNVINNLEDMKDRTEVKEEINEIDLLRREFNALQVQVKQSSTFIGSGAGSGEVRLEFLDDVQRSTAKVNGKFLKFDSSSGKFVGDDPSISTLALTALDIDGATDIGAAIVDADLFIIDDGAGGTNRKVTASRIKTYIGDHTDSLAADNLTIGDAAILLTTSSGNITIDAAANDSDIILKGTDGNADTTFLTIDGSAAGEATFNAGIVIADSGTIGSASDKDAISISSGGVVNISATTASTGSTSGALTVAGGMGVAADLGVGDDIRLDSDSSTIRFGVHGEIVLSHVHNVGLTVTNTVNGSDDAPVILQLKSEEDAIVADDVIASIEMAAGDSDGTDGATIAAGIHAIAEGTFSATANATKLVFTTGVSETAAASATAKMTLSSAGLLTIADDFMIKDGGTIGVASTNDAITISSAGIVTFKDDILIKDGGTIGTATDADAITIAAAGAVTLSQRSVHSSGITVADGGQIGSASDADAIAIAANGVVTFSQVPVLPDDTIETADIQDNAVTPAKIAGAVNAQTGTAYTSVIGDAFKTVTMSNGSANKLTIPPNSSVAYAVGDRIDVVMLGSGTTSIQGGSGVTVNAVSTGTVAIAAQFAAVSCLKIATDTWVAMGNHGGVS